MNKNNYYNLRIITNLNCDENCYFCYQKFKENIKLDKDMLLANMKIQKRIFPRCAFYGGESTLLDDLHDYIDIVRPYCKTISLTTNGNNLTEEKLKLYSKAGLNEIGISIPTIRNWYKVRKHNYDEVINNLLLAKKIIKNVRVNIVENIYNMNNEDKGGFEIYDMINYFIKEIGVGVLICRNFTKRFPTLKLFQKLDLEQIGGIKNGVKLFGNRNKKMNFCSYYESLKIYDRNDYIISPVGIFTKWTEFIRRVAKVKNQGGEINGTNFK